MVITGFARLNPINQEYAGIIPVMMLGSLRGVLMERNEWVQQRKTITDEEVKAHRERLRMKMAATKHYENVFGRF